jgi:hypothetical protein
MKPAGEHFRKTFILFLGLIALVAIESFFSSQQSENVIQPLSESNPCGLGLRVLDGKLIGNIDSLQAHSHRVYFKSEFTSEDSELNWYHNDELLLQKKCQASICLESIPPKKLKAGRWGVDLIAGRKLLCTLSFIVLSSS